MGTETKNLPYTPAILNDAGGNPAGRWSISFWVWDAQKKETVRKFDYSINKEIGKTPEETVEKRRIYAKARVKSINELLKDGYHINNVIESHSIDLNIRKGLEYALKISGLTGPSYNSYSSGLSIFLEWAEANGLASMQVDKFSRKLAYQYIDHRVASEVKGTTVNKDVGYMRALFGKLKKREIIPTNPFSELDKQKEEKSLKNIAYLDHEIELLKGEISVEDPELWTFVQIIYNTFLRPNEIRQLKTADVRLKDRLIYIDAKISKNNKSEFVTIPDSLLDTIIDLIKFKSSGDWLFPGKFTCISKNRMTSRHKVFLDRHNFSDDHTLYGWKHTGVCKAYKAGVDLKRIQLQCRHYSISQTDDYLKSMGLYENLEIKIKMPPL